MHTYTPFGYWQHAGLPFAWAASFGVQASETLLILVHARTIALDGIMDGL